MVLIGLSGDADSAIERQLVGWSPGWFSAAHCLREEEEASCTIARGEGGIPNDDSAFFIDFSYSYAQAVASGLAASAVGQ